MKPEEAVPTIRESIPDLRLLYCFGSEASGETTPDSDVDLAFLAGVVEPVARWELQEKLAAQLGRDVDLVDLRTASTVLRAQIVDGGRLLYEAAAPEAAAFETRALSAYARLAEERREIVRDIRERRSVHG